MNPLDSPLAVKFVIGWKTFPSSFDVSSESRRKTARSSRPKFMFPLRLLIPSRPSDVASDSGTIHVAFDEPEKGVAPGQVVGLWDESGKWCLGSGIIAGTTCLE